MKNNNATREKLSPGLESETDANFSFTFRTAAYRTVITSACEQIHDFGLSGRSRLPSKVAEIAPNRVTPCVMNRNLTRSWAGSGGDNSAF